MYIADFDNIEDFISALSPKSVKRGESEVEFDVNRPLNWNTGWTFRGQADSEWGLTPRLYRGKEMFPYREMLLHEIHLFDSFRENLSSFYEPYIEERDLNFTREMYSNMLGAVDRLPNELSYMREDFRTFPVSGMYKPMAFMQHIGLESRLLDWSNSPLVACYFAASDYSQHEKYTEKSKISVYALSVNKYEGNDISIERIEVPSVGNKRMSLQRGCFTVVKDIINIKEESSNIEEKDMKKLNLDDISEDGVGFAQFNLPAKLKPALLAHLDFLGINALTLFDSTYALQKGTLDKQFIKYYGDNQLRFGDTPNMEFDFIFNKNPKR